MQVLLNNVQGNLVSTVIAFIVLVFSYFVIYALMIRNIYGQRARRQYRVRSFYIFCAIFLFIMARIWVEGFTHLLAVLGLVSAALVVTNKETVMNFVGWLIINWRGLFTEDDIIQIQNHKGYVKSIGVLYFALSEMAEGINGNVTGRIIRIPNGLVANNPLINFSQASHLLEQHFSVVISEVSDIEYATDFLKRLVNEILRSVYKGKKEFSLNYLRMRHHQLADHISLEARVSIKPKFDKPIGTELTCSYYCFAHDADKITQKVWFTLLTKIKDEKKIKLSYSN